MSYVLCLMSCLNGPRDINKELKYLSLGIVAAVEHKYKYECAIVMKYKHK